LNGTVYHSILDLVVQLSQKRPKHLISKRISGIVNLSNLVCQGYIPVYESIQSIVDAYKILVDLDVVSAC